MSQCLDILLAGNALRLDPSGAVFWPEHKLLIVADLHFGRALRGARQGGALLPVYELDATLDKLEAVIARTNPKEVACLGDSFDFDGAERTLPEAARLRLLTLQAGRHWLWLTGNHDPAPLSLPGTHRDALTRDGLTLRHIADPAEQSGEISAHYHPKIRLAGRRHACFLLDQTRLILPAFGSFTGGMDIARPPLCHLMPTGMAVALGRDRLYRIPL